MSNGTTTLAATLPANGSTIVVYAVHGTWSSPKGWVSDSLLVNKLRDAGVTVRPFSWSGDNSHDHRLEWADKLAREITSVCCRDAHSRIILIGHSHGGTLAHYAAGLLSAPIRSRVHIVTMGSPILTTTSFRKRDVMLIWREGILCLLRSIDVLVWMYIFAYIPTLYARGANAHGVSSIAWFASFVISLVFWEKASLRRGLEMWLFDGGILEGEVPKRSWLLRHPLMGGMVISNNPPDEPHDYASGSSLVAMLTNWALRKLSDIFESRRRPTVGVADDITSSAFYCAADEAIIVLTILAGLQRALISPARVVASSTRQLYQFITRVALPVLLLFPLSYVGWFPEWMRATLAFCALIFALAVFVGIVGIVVAAITAALGHLVLFKWYGFGGGFSGLLWGSIHVSRGSPSQETHRVPIQSMIREGCGGLLHCRYYNVPWVVQRVIAQVARSR
jgi:hypothetical protein